MAQTAHRKRLNTTVVPVTVTNGEPNPSSITLPNVNTEIEFINNDDEDYLIEFWGNANQRRVAVCPILPANGVETFKVDPNCPNDRCYYNIVTLTGKLRNPTDDGAHVIVIGNGGGVQG